MKLELTFKKNCTDKDCMLQWFLQFLNGYILVLPFFPTREAVWTGETHWTSIFYHHLAPETETPANLAATEEAKQQ